MIDPIPYLESRKIDFHLAGEKNVSRGWVNIHCPFPDCDDPSWHCGINLESGFFNCFICGKKGYISHLIARLEDCSIGQAEVILKSLENIDFKGANTEHTRSYPDPLIEMPKDIKLPAEATSSFPPLHWNYLQSRGLNPEETIRKYHLKTCSNIGKYKFRIIIPYFMDGKLVTFSSRDVTGRGIPYKDCPPERSVIPVKEAIYNIDTIKDRILIVEGPIDVWKGGDGVVATSTINFSDPQVILLNNMTDKGVKTCFIMYDAEERAIAKANQLAERLNFEHAEVLKLSEPKDLGEMTEGEVRHLRKELGL